MAKNLYNEIGREFRANTARISLSSSLQKKKVLMVNPEPPSDISAPMEKVFHSASFAIITMDLAGNVTSWNQGAEKKFGWKSEEVMGRSNPVLPFDSLATFRKKSSKLKTTGSVLNVETKLKHKNGFLLDVVVQITPLVERNGNVEGFLLVMIESSGYKRDDQNIIELASQWQTTFNAVTDAICLLDLKGKIVQCNDAMGKMFGMEIKKMRGKHCWRVIHGTEKPIPECPIVRMKKSMRRESIEIQIDERWFDISVDPILAGENTLLGAVHIVRDITQRKKIEQALIQVASTFSNTGTEVFFWDLVSSTCLAMSADLVFVGEVSVGDPGLIQTIALCADGKPSTNFSYQLEGSPFQTVVGAKISCYPENVREKFPRDLLLADLMIEGYIGVPLVDSRKKPLGILVALYRNPIIDPALMESLIQIYASWASSELERRRDAREWQTAEQKLRDIVEHSTNLFYSHTPEHILTYVSPQSQNFLGCKPEEAMVRWMEFITDNPTNQDGFASTQRAIDTGQAQPPFELELKTRDGRIVWAEVNEAPVVQDGKTIAIVGSLTDITDSRLAQQTSHQSETSYRGLFNSVNEGVYIQGKDGRFLDVNRGAVRMYGYPREFLIGRKPEDIAAPGKNDMGKVYDKFAKAFDGQPQQFEFWGNRRNGEVFPMDVRLSKGTYYGQDVVIALATDITERKKVEAALQRQLKELGLLHAAAMFSVSAPDVDTLIKQVTDLFGKNLYPDDFGFLLLDQKTGALNPHPSYRAGTGLLRSIIPPGKGITGSVVLCGESRRVPDVTVEPEYFSAYPAARSELCVPLKVGGRIIGVINTESKQYGAFSDGDERLLVTLAGQVATAIERFRVQATEHEQRILAEALRDIATVLSSTLDFDQVLDRILENIDRVVPSKAASIMLVSNEIAHVIRHRGYIERGQKQWIENLTLESEKIPSLRRTLQDCRAQLISDTQMDADWVILPETNWIRSYLSAPILQNDKVVGLINLDHDMPEFYTPAHAKRLEAFASQAAVAIENARLYRNAVLSSERRAILHRLSQDVVRALQDTESTYEAIHEAAGRLMPCDAFVISLVDSQRKEYQLVYLMEGGMRFPSRRIPEGQGLSGMVISGGKTLVIDDVLDDDVSRYVHFGSPQCVRSVLATPLRISDKTVGMISAQCFQPRAYGEEEQVLLEMLASYAATAVDNARLFVETQHRLNILETVNRISTGLRAAHNVQEMMPRLLDETLAVLNTDSGVLWLHNPISNTLEEVVSRGWFKEIRELPVSPGEGIAGKVYQTGETIISSEFSTDERSRESIRGQIPPGWGGVCVPIRTMQEVIGVLFVSVRIPRQLDQEDVNLLVTISEMAGNAIRRAALFEQSERQVQRLAALRAIDMVISSMLDLHVALQTLLELIVAQLKVDAADVLLFNHNSQMLEFEAGIGFRTNVIRQTRMSIGQSLAGRAALERTRIHIPNLRDRTSPLSQQKMIHQEDFLEYHGVPLVAKGQIVGVLEIYNRSPLTNDSEWLDFLDTVASEVAIEIDNSRMFEGLQRSNTELSLAYDRTIEGWSHALDLRDRETEGHTQRVTRKTEELARVMGLTDQEIVHARRGALLHDIGKMGVPDRILHKTGPLDADEWDTMRQHPVFAYEMLSSIAYLKPALDIPYCHHEWWDGSGYPRGLKGEQIPLAARIFAVVDVWDALSSDRPYRKAWKREDIVNQMHALKGKQFDPIIVDRFLKMVESEQ